MYIMAEGVFYAKEDSMLPKAGFRPDAVFCGKDREDYWGITFIDLSAAAFDTPMLAMIKFTFDETHYSEVETGQRFLIMEGPHQVGEGIVVSTACEEKTR